MLTESFIASIIRPDAVPSHFQHKDAGIYFHELQPLPGIKAVLKKSSTNRNCLAANSTHVFAAQADKAVVHVYNIERGAQECLIPFSQKITSLTLIGDRESNSILALGDNSGKVILWELATGRQVSSLSAHLQTVTCLAVDPTNNFLLSGSEDTNVHVWSIPKLLSFAPSNSLFSEPDSSAPLHVLANHRGVVTSLAAGHSFHSANIAISASEDNSCIVWNHRTGSILHTFLLTSTPLSLALDPADRGFYVGLTDGSVQMIDFYNKATIEHSSYNGTAAVSEPSKTDRWERQPGASQTNCLAVTHDGTKVLTGHDDGKLYIHDTGTGKLVGDSVSTLLGPITNLTMLPVQGLLRHDKECTEIPTVVKPKHVALLKVPEDGSESLPENYTFNARFTESLMLPALPTPRTLVGEPHIEGFRESLAEDMTSILYEVGYSREHLDKDIAALQSSDGPDRPRSILAAASGNGEHEKEELHRLLARSTQETLELKERNQQLGQDLVRLRQAERDRKRMKKIKQSRRAQANELRRKAYIEDSSQLNATGGGPPIESHSDSDDLSVGG